MKKLLVLGIFFLSLISRLWSMEDEIKKRPRDHESNEIKELSLQNAENDEHIDYLDLVPEEILLLIIHVDAENLKKDMKSCNVDKAQSAYKQYNILRSVNTAFRRILPGIPLSMNCIPLIKELFLKAAKTGNLHMLDYLCKNNFASIKQAFSRSKEWIISDEKDSSTTEEYLPQGFNLNKFSYEDWLIAAIGYGNIEFCKKLIEEGLFNEVENAPLIHAIILQDREQVRSLIESGNGQGMLFDKYTETMVAAACGNIDIFTLFSSPERNFTIVDIQPSNFGNIYSTSLRCAARNGHIELVRILVKIKNDYGKLKYDYNHSGDRAHALVEAIAQNQRKVALFLLSLGWNPVNNSTAYGNMTALGSACKSGQQEIVKLLLNRGAEVNVKLASNLYKSALRLACRSGNRKIVKKLLCNSADVNICSQWPILMVPIVKGDLPMAQLLVEHGADINATGFHKTTPLIQAVVMGHTELVKWLVSNNANINHRDEEGFTAADHARKEKKDEILHFLLMHGGIETNHRLN